MQYSSHNLQMFGPMVIQVVLQRMFLLPYPDDAEIHPNKYYYRNYASFRVTEFLYHQNYLLLVPHNSVLHYQQHLPKVQPPHTSYLKGRKILQLQEYRYHVYLAISDHLFCWNRSHYNYPRSEYLRYLSASFPLHQPSDTKNQNDLSMQQKVG